MDLCLLIYNPPLQISFYYLTIYLLLLFVKSIFIFSSCYRQILFFYLLNMLKISFVNQHFLLVDKRESMLALFFLRYFYAFYQLITIPMIWFIHPLNCIQIAPRNDMCKLLAIFCRPWSCHSSLADGHILVAYQCVIHLSLSKINTKFSLFPVQYYCQ